MSRRFFSQQVVRKAGMKMALSEFERRRLAGLEFGVTGRYRRRYPDPGAGTVSLIWCRWPGGFLVALCGVCLGVLGSTAQLGGLAVLGAILFFGGTLGYVGQWALDQEDAHPG